MINYPDIDWHDQCKICLKAINTSHCAKNQGFMEKLNTMKNEYIGDLEFECEYFSPDKRKINLKQNEGNE